jgi:DNA-binding transcriptional LysR family regulator
MLDDLQLFLDVIAAESFAHCARGRGMTRAQVAKRIARLEARLGAPLFHRSTRHMRLTVQGDYLAKELEPLLQAIESSCDTIREAGDQLAGTLRVNASFSFGLSRLAPCLQAFSQKYPKVHLDIVLGSFFHKAFAGSFDIVLTHQVSTAKTMRSERICQQRTLTCATPDYLNAHEVIAHPKDLLEHNCLIYAHPGERRDEWHFQENGKDLSVKVKGHMTFNSSMAILQAGKASIGVVDLPDYICGDAIASGELKSILDDYAMGVKGIYACYPWNKNIPRKVDIFVQFLKTYFTTHPVNAA